MTLPQTFDAFVPCNIPDFLARAKSQARYIPLTELRALGLEKVYKPSSDLIERLTTKPIFDHSLRLYYFSLLILHSGFPSGTPGVPQITREELFKRIFLACILHDIALSQDDFVTKHPAHGMSFELHGGIMVYEHLHDQYPSLNAAEVGDVAQGIMLHTLNPYFKDGVASAVNFLVAQTALFDVTGYGSLGPDFSRLFGDLLNRDAVREIETVYPRGAILSREITADFTEMLKEKPNSVFCHIAPNAFEVINSVTNLADSH